MDEVCLGAGLLGVVLLVVGLADPVRVTPLRVRGSRAFVLGVYGPLACVGALPFVVPPEASGARG